MKSFFTWVFAVFFSGLAWAAFVAFSGLLVRLNWELFLLGWRLL